MNLDKIKYYKNETIVSDNLKIKVEIKGIGPQTTVLPKSRIILTNERIIISQKALFRSKYFVKYIIWFESSENRKTHHGFGITELIVEKNDIKEISENKKTISELKFKDKYVRFIKIFINIIIKE